MLRTRACIRKYLRKGLPRHTVERFSPETIVRLILGAGGVPVWAHPMNGHANYRTRSRRCSKNLV
ncbi:MAG: hypothetical protein R2881_05485 [Eubacteriales bacterium]